MIWQASVKIVNEYDQLLSGRFGKKQVLID